MFFVFASAVVLVSVLVGLIALVDSWWILGLVFAGHLIATAVVSAVIARALTGRTGRSNSEGGESTSTAVGAAPAAAH